VNSSPTHIKIPVKHKPDTAKKLKSTLISSRTRTTNKYSLLAGTTYEQDDEEADKIYESVNEAMDLRRRARRCVSRVSLVIFSSD